MNNEINELLPFLIPLAALQLILMITALVMAIRQQTFRYLNKPVWVLIIILFNLIGPILYFVLERR
ncbi:PLDc N-terminal domain-containing protein [Salinicoccus halitifaciens]|uniref:Cardiolipin synthase N-terminal domain-containing protein n=1 Tax=Salinicoccus halitifaciens TaxID=1073415 RepID=A0ABV2EA11_9STAP|nr:PLDc N-terminal domain-containing protein [Salinicoccus halitifaciens]MCD2137759.1 PLDc N-terminal domain-containing protein [Salinicoccus halitifaciens]